MKMETTVNRNMRVLVLLGLAAFAIAVTALLTSGFAAASSHREAPAISQDAFADTTDVYAFIPPGVTDTVVLIASWIPFEGPEGGPNYWEFDDQVLYNIHVDNNGDAVSDITYTLKANTTTRNGDTFLYNTGPINSISDTSWNRPQTYTVTEYFTPGTQPMGGTRDHAQDIVANELAAPANIGSKSTPDYASLVAEATYTYNDSRNGDELTIFAGQTDDAFWVDLQVFDLLTLRGQPSPIGYGGMGTNDDPVDSVAGFNTHSLVLEVPVSRLTQGSEPVIGVWATSQRTGMGSFTGTGDPVQVSRLGMPLVNEAVIPLALKDTFNAIQPEVDLTVYGLLQESVEDPELGNLLCGLYGVPLPGDSDNDCVTEYTAGTPRTGRGDIFDIFLTGMVLTNSYDIVTGDGTTVTLAAGTNVNQPAGVVPAEMLRLNTALAGDICRNDPDFSRLGVFGRDACGFPNGRRLTDDVVEIELLAVAGAAYELLDDRDGSFTFNTDLIAVLDDGINANDVPFTTDDDRNHGLADQFPYMALAQSGQDHLHDNPMGTNTAINLDSLQSAGMFDSALPEIALGLLALTTFVGIVYATRMRANRQ